MLIPVGGSEFSQTEATLVGFSLHRTQRNFTERDRLILTTYCVLTCFRHMAMLNTISNCNKI